MGKVQCTYY